MNKEDMTAVVEHTLQVLSRGVLAAERLRRNKVRVQIQKHPCVLPPGACLLCLRLRPSLLAFPPSFVPRPASSPRI